MKLQYLSIAVVACSMAIATHAQVNDPNKVVQTAATNHANSDMNNAAESGLNKAETGIKGLFKKKNKTTATGNNNTAAPTPVVNAATQQSPVADTRAYNNYDFVPGDKIVFEDHFTDDAEGEFPTHWDLIAGQAVVNKMADEKAFLLTDGNYCRVKPLMKTAAYLGDVFTIEYDTYVTEGAYTVKLYLFDNDKQQLNFGNINVNAETAGYEAENSEGKSLSGNMPAAIGGSNFLNKWHHVAIAYKNKQIKIYVDQFRVAAIPNSNIVPGAFEFDGIGNQDNPILLKNIRVALGGNMNMLGKKFTDAKIITHGINFDIDKASIKPESMGTLNMIVNIMKENPTIKFEVDGHTDNSGAAAHNLTLSQQRAEAVKNQLITMGVDATRLTSKGLGDTKPISDNNSLEGKANNRRVEFVKL